MYSTVEFSLVSAVIRAAGVAAPARSNQPRVKSGLDSCIPVEPAKRLMQGLFNDLIFTLNLPQSGISGPILSLASDSNLRLINNLFSSNLNTQFVDTIV